MDYPLCIVVLIGVIVYFCTGKKSSFSKGTVDNKDVETNVKIETLFKHVGGLGSLRSSFGQSVRFNTVSRCNEIAATEFADLVSDNSEGSSASFAIRDSLQPTYNGANMKPMERLSRISRDKSLMPRTSREHNSICCSVWETPNHSNSVRESIPSSD